MIIEKRISDISKISKARQPFVAKCYYLGYIVGSSNGEYSTDRKFNPSGKFSEATADYGYGELTRERLESGIN